MNKQLLLSATAPDQKPTPGYVLSELARATLTSYPASSQLEDFLILRLNQDNPNVKFKCLTIIKHICRTGRPDFKREIARRAESVKKCLQFRGVLDPIQGDEINKRVREAAKDAMDAIFDDQLPVSTSAVAASNRIQGMGSTYNDVAFEINPTPSSSYSPNSFSLNRDTASISPYHVRLSENSSNGSGSGSGSSVMQSLPYRQEGENGGHGALTGIGNPNFKNEKTWMQMAREKVSYASANVSAGATGLSSSNTTRGNWFNNMSGTGAGAGGEGGRESNLISQHEQDLRAQQMRNGISAGIAMPTPSGSRSTPPFMPSSYNQSASSPNTTSSSENNTGEYTSAPPIYGKSGSAASDGGYERALVCALCDPGGLKAAPVESDLRTFLVTAASLSPDAIGLSLVEQLNSDHWQSRNKALVVIESFTTSSTGSSSSGGSGCEDHAAWWFAGSSLEAVESMCGDSKASVRVQAARTLRALKGSTPTPRPPSSSSSVSSFSSPSFSSPTSVAAEVSVNSSEFPGIIGEVSLIDWDNSGQPNSISESQSCVSSSNACVALREDELMAERREIAILLDIDADQYSITRRHDASPSLFDQLTISKNYEVRVAQDTPAQITLNSSAAERRHLLDTTPQTSNHQEVGDIFAGLNLTSLPHPLLHPITYPTPSTSSTVHTTTTAVTYDELNGLSYGNTNSAHSFPSPSSMPDHHPMPVFPPLQSTSCPPSYSPPNMGGLIYKGPPVPVPAPIPGHWPVTGVSCQPLLFDSDSYSSNGRNGINVPNGVSAPYSSDNGGLNFFNHTPLNTHTHTQPEPQRFRDSKPPSNALPSPILKSEPIVDSFSFLTDVLKSSSMASQPKK